MVRVLLICSLLLLPVFASAKTLTFGDQKWDVDVGFQSYAAATMTRNNFSVLDLTRSSIFGQPMSSFGQLLSEQTIAALDPITTAVNQPAQDAKLVSQDNHATDFNPGQNGQTVDLYSLAALLQSDAATIELPVIISQPKVPLADTNNLGINELVSIGESNFKGSPHNRIFNINIGAKKFDGLIIQPGEEFSFNKYLGAVDGEHGFLPELVIKPAGVTPEFGGGLCQVSSTAFRAAMNAGFPITARRNHSFAVQYYAPQGTDATIYPGSADLKFINDSPGPILIHTKIIGTKLYFEYYGTKDQRQVAFDGPVQYDKKSDGSMKATWTRHVTNNGQTVTQVFNSKYLPPALFHPVTPPLVPVPTPEPPAEPIPTTITPTT